MKEYIVSFKPKRGGVVQFSTQVVAKNKFRAARLVARYHAAKEFVQVTEYVRDIWTPVASALVEHLHNLDVARGVRSLGD